MEMVSFINADTYNPQLSDIS